MPTFGLMWQQIKDVVMKNVFNKFVIKVFNIPAVINIFQDEKNKILTTNIWLNLVIIGTCLEKNTRGFNRVIIYSQNTFIQQLKIYFNHGK